MYFTMLFSSFVMLKLRMQEYFRNTQKERGFYGEFFDVINPIPKTFVGEIIRY